MHRYPRNSPEAAARVVALILLADGHLGQAELDVLRRHDVAGRIGLSHLRLMRIVQTLRDDLEAAGDGPSRTVAQLSGPELGGMLDDIDDPHQRLALLQLGAVLSGADGHLADGEHQLLCTLAVHWDLPLHMPHQTGWPVLAA